MTVADWLGERAPAAPDRLAVRIDEALGARAGRPRADAADACVAAAGELLVELLAGPSTGRASALDLLTVDALVTYAFEAAATEPSTLEGLASAAMAMLAAAA